MEIYNLIAFHDISMQISCANECELESFQE